MGIHNLCIEMGQPEIQLSLLCALRRTACRAPSPTSIIAMAPRKHAFSSGSKEDHKAVKPTRETLTVRCLKEHRTYSFEQTPHRALSSFFMRRARTIITRVRGPTFFRD